MTENEIINLNENTEIELGDVIQFQTKGEITKTEQAYYVNYVDENKMKVIDTDMKHGEEIIFLSDISSITLLYRDEKKGYALQHKLLPNTWVNIKFDEDVPVIITGEITNLEKDMIEITVYNSKMFKERIIYIDFAYKGLPEDLPIEYIQLRNRPFVSAVVSKESGEILAEPTEIIESEKEIIESNFLQDNIANADIIFGNELATITQFVNVDVSQQRYNLSTQTNDMLDNMLSKLGPDQKNSFHINKIHTVIERYIQLRKEYSTYDVYGNVKSFIDHASLWKPLAENLEKFAMPLSWILPVGENNKKIYDIQLADNEVDVCQSISLISDLLDLEKGFKQYRGNNIEEKRYESLMIKLDKFFMPFTDSDGAYQLSKIPVHTSMPAIITNGRSVYEDNIISKKFYMDRYVKKDVLNVYSITTLPYLAMVFSRLALPSTNIMDKANLNKTFLWYSKLLNEATDVNVVTVEDLEESNQTFEDSITNYRLSQFIIDKYVEEGHEELYKLFLSKIIPTTDSLLTILDKYSKGKISFTNIINTLEPFLIYSKDISNKEFIKINNHIELKMKLYVANYDHRYNLFKLLNRFVLNITRREPNSIFNLLHSNFVWDKIDTEKIARLKLGYTEQYKEEEEEETDNNKKENKEEGEEKETDNNKKENEGEEEKEDADLLQFSEKPKMTNGFLQISPSITLPITFPNINYEENNIKEDSQIIYNSKNIKYSNSELLRHMTLMDFGNLFNTGLTLCQLHLMVSEDINAFIMSDKKSVKSAASAKQCDTVIISKKYNSQSELEQDNGRPTFFDKEYDKTPYNILDKYAQQATSKSPKEFHAFLTEELVKKYKYTQQNAQTVAEIIINQKKPVTAGDYAILFSEDLFKLTYYKRDNSNTWILDRKITDKPEDFSCVSSDSGDSLDKNKSAVKSNLLDAILKQFDAKYEISKLDLENNLKVNYVYYKQIIFKLLEIHFNIRYKYALDQYKIGLQLLDEENTDTIIVSPYQKGLDLILGQTDFVKKQNDIIQFAGKFAREPLSNTDEDENWLYCIKTNTKLLPIFKKNLAAVFVQDPEKYSAKIDEIIQTNGILLEDGDVIVDKYSGWKISDINFAEDEGYDESGFKINTKAVIEKDVADFILDDVIYSAPEIKIISNVLHAFSETMGLTLPQTTREFIVNLASNTFDTMITSKEIYNKKAAEAALKGKKMPSYETTYNTYIIYLTIGSLLLGIQTSIPSFKTKKTFPGCIKSFTGYPLDGVGDESSIDYLACVAYKMKTAVPPWNALSSEENIKKILLQILNEKLLPNLDVKFRLDQKRNYLVANPVESIPDEHNINSWTNFLPPLKAFKIKPLYLQNITKEFLNLKTKYREKILIIESKIIAFSLGIQEKIYEVIKDKTMVLTNMANEPFLENSCCLETSSNIMNYFQKENPEIIQFNNSVIQLSKYLSGIEDYSKANFFFSKENTKKKFPALSDLYEESTIYKGFINICKFNSHLPMPSDLIKICSKKPDAVLAKNESITEQIIKLKAMGFNYDNQQFIKLLQLQSKRHIINVTMTPVIHQEMILKDVLAISTTTFSAHLLKVVESDFKENLVIDFKNFLLAQNKDFRNKIYMFIVENSKNTTKKNLLKIQKVIETTTTFSDINDQNVITFIKNSAFNLLSVFPSIILNQVNYSSIDVPAYFNLSSVHILELKKQTRDYYNNLKEYYNDNILSFLLNNIVQNSADFMLLIKETPYFENKPDLNMLIYNFYFYKSIMEYIDASSQKKNVMRTSKDNYDEYDEDEYNEIIDYGNNSGLKKRVAELILTFFDMFNTQKSKINNLSYDKIMDVVIMTKEAIKDTFTDMLKKMTVAERQTDTMLKINKLGKWNAGLQKGLTVYVKEVYEEDVDKMAEILNAEKNMLTKFGEDHIEEFDVLERKRLDEQLDNEAYDMTGLSPDYEDGNYENDDQEYDEYN